MKKTILLIAGLLMFAVLATGCLGGTPTDTPADTQEEFEATTAQEQLDTDIVIEAVKKKNSDLCKTVENGDQKQECLSLVQDKILIDQAKEEMDLDLCGDISRSNTKEQCEILVQELIEKEKVAEELRKKNEETDEQREKDIEYLDSIDFRDITPEHCEKVVNEDLKEGCLAELELFGEF